MGDLVVLLHNQKVSDLPADVWAGIIYLLSSLGLACLIDIQALLHMFLRSANLHLTWISAIGLSAAALKLAAVNKVQNYESLCLPKAEMAYGLVSGGLQLNA